VLASGAPLHAGEPEIRNLNVRGLQVGGTTTLVVDGDDLGTAPRLWLTFPAKVVRKPGSTAAQATFDVTIDPGMTPGLYHLRVTTDGGISLPVVIGVDGLPQRPLVSAPTTPPVTLPVCLHGTVSGSAAPEVKFEGKSGQKILAEVEAGYLGSKLRPVLHLYSPKRVQLAWSWAGHPAAGETRLEAALPEDGVYTVTVHDMEYAGAAPGHFRLKLGQWSFADSVFPPVVGKDTRSVEVVGSAPVRLDLPAAGLNGIVPLLWPKEGIWSGPRPFVRVSNRTEILETPASAKGQDVPAGPVGVTGRLLIPEEEDRYRVPVTPGTKVRLEVFAERLGSPLDVTLVVRNEAGAEVARVEDSPGTLDPVLEYTVPDKVTSVLVGVIDAQGRGGPRGIYRLTIDPQVKVPRSDFGLFTPARRVGLPLAGRSVVPVMIERRGYQGAVELLSEGLPPGVRIEGNAIPAGADGTLMTIHRGEWTGDVVLTRWRGRAADGQERPVLLKGDPLERLQPWLAGELPLAPTTGKAADFQIDWRALPAEAGLAPAGKLLLPVKLTRPATPSLVRLTLLTSQVPPLLNNAPDPNRTLRPEKPVELADKVAQGDFTVLVPADLPAPSYDLTIQADLLTPDRRSVLATAYAPVRRLPVRLPLVVLADGPPRIEAKRDPKTGLTAEIRGKVERREGFTGEVDLALTGLPPGGRADPVKLKAGETAFVVKVVLPPTAPAGEIPGLKLTGSVVPDPKQPAVRVRSRDVELTLAVPAGK
jgi:hypothetical protein